MSFRLLAFASLLPWMFIAAASPAGQPASAPYPRIAMLWSQADNGGPRLHNWAKHSLILVGVEDLGLQWTANKFPAMSETIDRSSIAEARATMAKLRQINPRAVVLFEMYFFEANEKDYPPDSAWWARDAKGQRIRFWPGCYNMDLSNADYVRHIARRIAAVHQALDGYGGLFLDNLRFEAEAKAAWTKLLHMVRHDCGDMPILVNAGWDSTDLAWVAPLVNGIMYEDSIAHITDRDPEKYYARIAATDRLLRSPRIGVNERFGTRKDEARMVRELLRTLVYTDMNYLYSDSTDGHKHPWWPQWDVALGRAVGQPATPAPGKLARREFEGGIVLWLPTGAKEMQVKLGKPMRVLGETKQVSEVTLHPHSGVILLWK